MGNPKQKWTAEEEEALRAGIAKYGAGKWKFIQRDPEFNKFLHSRSNIDLKDKWRNMSAAAGLSNSREKSKTPKAKTNQDAPVVPMLSVQPPTSELDFPNDSMVGQMKDDPTKEFDSTFCKRYLALIFEALSSSKPNGLDLTALLNYIEEKTEVPQNFRKQLGSRLRRLVKTDKLDKVDNHYRLKSNYQPEAPKPTPSIKDVRPKQVQSSAEDLIPCESLEAAAKDAAYKVTDAESKTHVAAEAVKDAERIARMSEESDSILQFAKDMFDICSRGQVVLLAQYAD